MRHDTERAIRRLERYHVGTCLIPLSSRALFFCPSSYSCF
jgi:hypothetical protein